jgi:TldD protein
MRALLAEALEAGGESDELLELRWVAKSFRTVTVTNGRVERVSTRHRAGVGVRVRAGGVWGFAATGSATPAAIASAVEAARRSARTAARLRAGPAAPLGPARLARGDYGSPGCDEARARPLEALVALAVEAEAAARAVGSALSSSSATVSEILESRAVCTSDGADAAWGWCRPELQVQAVRAGPHGPVTGRDAVGVTGGFGALLAVPAAERARRAVEAALALESAAPPEGGRHTVILAPDLVGLLVHEAIGHTVEADFVLAGSAARGRLGQQVASPLVTLRDIGPASGAGGWVPVDDEGVEAQDTPIIENGVLVGYLHNRETAAHFGVAPTGNARAWEHADPPLVRMRNTCIDRGTADLDALIADTPDGYLLLGAANGQADSTAEFTFGVQLARRIRHGKLAEVVRGVTVTGDAFAVLGSVDAVTDRFAWDLGSGHCGKGQPARVDAGGPWLRCTALLAGAQEADA